MTLAVPAPSRFVQSLNALAPGSVGIGGVKACSLARLHVAGLPVPAAVVLSAKAFPTQADMPTSLEPTIAQALWEEITNTLGAAGDTSLVVRSSGVAEDLADASWAGQYESVLGVQGRVALQNAVVRCWRSAFAARTRVYGGDATMPLAVLVQRQVEAVSAGVAFTADPVTGARGVTVIEAVAGLGDALVSGRQTPERFRVERGGKVVRSGGPVRVLDHPTVLRIAELAQQAGRVSQCACDVEWCFDGQQVWIVQARPITSLVAEPVPIEEEVPSGSWERDDHHSVVSPMMLSLLSEFLEGFAEVFDEYGVPARSLEFRAIRGHVYSRVVPLGKDGPVPPSWVLWLYSRLSPTMQRLNRRARRIFESHIHVRDLERWHNAQRSVTQQATLALSKVDLRSLGDGSLVEHLELVVHHFGQAMKTHARLGVAETIALGELCLAVSSWIGWDDHRTLGALAGRSPRSTEDARALLELVRDYSGPRPAALAEPIGRHTRARLAAQAPELARRFETWLEIHGKRQLDYDPRHPTILERPEIALAALSQAFSPSLEEAQRCAERGREQLLEAAHEALAGQPERAKTLERLLSAASLARRTRDDNAMDNYAAPMGLIRLTLLEIADRCVKQGLLACRDDVFFLRVDEAGDLLAHRLDDMRSQIEVRRGQFVWARMNPGPARYGPASMLPPYQPFPSGLRFALRILHWRESSDGTRGGKAPRGLSGTPGGGGRYTGPVRIIRGPEQFSELRSGDVLVCRVTTTTWTMLFPIAGAVVTEEGGTLSHAAIVARELSVPAVLGTSLATSVLKDGQRVTVDGDRGTVEVVSAG